MSLNYEIQRGRAPLKQMISRDWPDLVDCLIDALFCSPSKLVGTLLFLNILNKMNNNILL